MTTEREVILLEEIAPRVLHIRGHNVILDMDLARMYGTTTKALNQAVKRNAGRFPAEFMFRLTNGEKQEVVTNCDHLQRLKFSPTLPYAFTEHGAIMAASVLNTPRAVEVSVIVVRTFIKLREMLASHKDLAGKLNALERKYDAQFKVVFDAIRQLMAPPPEPKGRGKIGFARRGDE
jgi:hypothetical protein